jgi:2-iminobutanoate/2-iminopropanoate deaminase
MSQPVGPYTPVVQAGEFLFVSGQIGIVDGSVVEGGLDAEVPQAMANLAGHLEAHGASLAHVVKTTLFVTDMNDYARVNELYIEALGDHRPARSCVEVAALPAGAIFELEAIAHLA